MTPWATVWRWKEVRIGWTSPKAGGVLLQALHQRQGGRDQAILAKLGLAHRQDASVKVNIGDTQMQHLAEPEAAAIQQAEDFGHDEVAQRRVRSRRELIDRVKELLNLGVGQDAWRETGTAHFTVSDRSGTSAG